MSWNCIAVPGSPDDHWVKQIDFIHTIISGSGTDEGLNIGPNQTRVGLVTFGDTGELYFDFNEHTVSNNYIVGINYHVVSDVIIIFSGQSVIT